MLRLCTALSVAMLAVIPALLAAPVSVCPPHSDPDHPVFLPSDQSCSLFYLCSNGRAIPLTCPGGLYFNVGTDQCDYRYNVNCTEPTTEPPVWTTTEVPSSTPVRPNSTTTEVPSSTPVRPNSTTTGSPVPTTTE